MKLISFEAFASPTVAEIAPLHVSVRLSLLVEVVTILSPSRYNGLARSELGDVSTSLTALEFLAANSQAGCYGHLRWR